jgi:hypothetical protein
MADLFVVLPVSAFFGLCVGLVSGCDRIIGPDEPGAFDAADTADVDGAGVAEGAAR